LDRTDLDTILEMVAQDYVAAKTNQTVVKIAFPVVVILLLVALVWFIVVRRARQRKANQIES
jgi:type III secretory pathway component EscT